MGVGDSVPAVRVVFPVTEQYDALVNDKITYNIAQPSTSTVTNEIREQNSVDARSDGYTSTRTYRYSEATVRRITQTLASLDILNNEKLRGKTTRDTRMCEQAGCSLTTITMGFEHT
jgi:hypothetical protein